MKHLKKTICLITAFIMAVSFASCSDEDANKEITDSVPEETEDIANQEPETADYKLTEYYEAAQLSEFTGITGEISEVAYAGDHMFVISDDATYTSASGYKMCDFEAYASKKGEYYNAPKDYTAPENTYSCTVPDTEDTITVEDITGAEKVFGVYSTGVLYSDGIGVYLYNLITKTSRAIETADPSGMTIADAFYDETLKKYTVVYEENPQVMKYFYVTDIKGKIKEDTKMTMGNTGTITDVHVTAAGDMYFAKSSNYTETDIKGNVTPYSTFDVYRMKSDGTLNRIIYDERIAAGNVLSDVVAADNGDIYVELFNEQAQRIVQKYNQSGSMVSSVYFPENLFCENIFCSGDDLWIAYNDDGMISLAPLKDKTIDTAVKIKTGSRTCRDVISGDDKYDIYLSDDYALYGYSLSDGNHEIILEWSDADIDLHDTEFIAVTDEEDIWCMNSDGKFILKKADDARLAQINSKKIITVAGDIYNNMEGDRSSSDIYNLIRKFNTENDEYFIHAVDYMKYSTASLEKEEFVSGTEKLWSDIEEGFTPDVVIYTPSETDYTAVLRSGMFADFKELMKDDSDVKFDDISENIAEFCTYNGSLCTLFPTYRGYTMIQDLNYSENDKMWTMSDFLNSVEPDNTGYRYNMEALDAFLEVFISEHVDYEKGECDFSNRNFKNLLEWANEFDSAEEFEEALAWGAYDNVNPSYRPPVRKYYLTDPWAFSREQAENYDDVVVKGWPSDSGIGMEIEPGIAFSVLEKSASKDAAWNFIKQFFTDDAYGYGNAEKEETEIFTKPCNGFFPVRKSIMEKKISDSISLKYELEYYGEDYYPVWYDGDYETEVPEVTKETEEKFRKAVESPVFMERRDSDIRNIIKEEAEKYFADEQNARETADEVQKRVTEYISEKSPAQNQENAS